ncbi:MAG: MOSC domain-containing protein, partial [Egibacteraceae bacterium]
IQHTTAADPHATVLAVHDSPGWGEARLEVAQPRVPCYKLGIRMGDDDFPRQFTAAGRPGAYLRILEEGDVGAGDAVEVVHRPGHGVTVATVTRCSRGAHHCSQR